MCFTVDFDEDFIDMPAPILWTVIGFFLEILGEKIAKFIPPIANSFMANINRAHVKYPQLAVS